MEGVRTWIEIDAKALRHNAEQFLKLIPPETRLMAVIKSNAYGHGLVHTAKILASQPLFVPTGRDEKRLWFGVDSVVEALRLRKERITNPVLVLGCTLPGRMAEAGANGIALTVSNFDSLRTVAALKKQPPIHIKIDTGMHRQGFLPQDTFKLLDLLRRFKISPQGVYTHFASAKDPNEHEYTLRQLALFGDVISEFKKAGISNLIRHAAASGGTLLLQESRLDMVRIGMGLYGYWPSLELKIPFSTQAKLKTQNSKLKTIELRPVLMWKTIIGEVKEIPKGALVGYDGTERVRRQTRIAVLPIGYWHGYDRRLSGVGQVLIRGRRARVLGRISMDMTVVDITDIPGAKVGDEAVLAGRQGKDAMWADEVAERIGTTHYEFLTRTNPLIRRIIVNH